MSQAVLLACMIFENEETLLPLKEELRITGLQSFRMNLNLKLLRRPDPKNEVYLESKPVLSNLINIIEELKKCTSSWFISNNRGEKIDEDDQQGNCKLTLDFFVDDKTKNKFKKIFSSSFELFRFLEILYELNANIVSTKVKAEVYESEGFYTNEKLPVPSPEDQVFHFLDYMILKKVNEKEKPKELLLREFSDGEHQFIHTIGICILLKNRRTLLLLDEPENSF